MFDVNARIGHWPYRPVGTVDDLLKNMDALGISCACVSSLDAIHFLNPQDGNDSLARAIAPHRDRLVPLAVVRPEFAGWQDDLTRCLESHGMRGVVLYPNYHLYDLDDPEATELGARCSEAQIPVFVQVGLEDARRQFGRTIVPDVSLESVGAFGREHPSLKLVALGLKFGQPDQLRQPLPKNFYFDTSNYERLGDLEFAVSHFGVDRILFGTCAPLFHPRANADKLRCADLTAEQREAIGQGNARALFGL
ncbi:MAG: amidohydrolase family protein [Candidatus Hydrogenedentes bacterium]|nr:amidohydrolase family protein [Candidatus Hydrogenedentota bacterium]